MKTVTYFCDRCKSATIDDLTLIEVSVRKESWNFHSARFSQEWCDKCCKKLKIELQRPSLPDPKDPVSLESVLKEFVLSTIESAKYGD